MLSFDQVYSWLYLTAVSNKCCNLRGFIAGFWDQLWTQKLDKKVDGIQRKAYIRGWLNVSGYIDSLIALPKFPPLFPCQILLLTLIDLGSGPHPTQTSIPIKMGRSQGSLFFFSKNRIFSKRQYPVFEFFLRMQM